MNGSSMAALFAMIVIAPHIGVKFAVVMNGTFWIVAVVLAVVERMS